MTVTDFTIAAPITPPGVGGVSIVRVSGPESREIAKRLLPKASELFAKPRELIFGPVMDLLANSGSTRAGESVLDYALSVFFQGPKSFTGEDSLELNLHGSAYLIERLLENITSLGARLADPGEFSKRAFLNGRMDLCQAEAVCDLIQAETAAQARTAREQLEGRLSQAVFALGEPLRDLLAEIEAYIDFPDEGIEPLTFEEWAREIELCLTKLEEYLNAFSVGRLYREGARVAIVGAPNAGKSSLLNCLSGEKRVIVTSQAGTTRDSVEERISLGGYYLRLWDTAGIFEKEDRERLDEAEKLGIKRSWQRLKQADLTLFVFDAKDGFSGQSELFARVIKQNAKLLILANKIDLLSDEELVGLEAGTPGLEAGTPGLSDKVIPISALSGSGISELKQALCDQLFRAGSSYGSAIFTNRRHFDALKKGKSALSEASLAIAKKRAPELISVDLREALGSLNEIVGVTDSEDILGRIFSKFCVGK